MNQISRINRTTKGYLLGVISTALWSSATVFVSYISKSQNMPPLLLMMWRNILVCLILFPILMIFAPNLLKFERKQLLLFLLYGFVLAMDNAVNAVSVQYNGASVATVMIYGSAAFTAILAWRFYGEKIGKLKMLAVVVCLAGCVLASNAYSKEMWHLNAIGIISGLLSGFSFSLYTLMGKETSDRGINTWKTMFFSYASASLFLMIFNVILICIPSIPVPPDGIGCRTLIPSLQMNAWLALLGQAFIPTIIGSGLYLIEMSYIPVNTANLIGTLEPFFTGVQAYFLLHERMSGMQLLGGGVIVIAVLFAHVSDRSN